MKNEPVLTQGAILAVIQAALAALVSFGVELTSDQTAALMALSTSVLAAIFAVVVRSRVTPLSRPRDNEGNDLVPLRGNYDES